MGFLSQIKQLFFVNKSIAKSAADKTSDFAMEKGDILMDSGKEMLTDITENVSSTAGGLRDAIFEKGMDVMEGSKDIMGNLGDKIDELGETDLAKKAQSLTEDVGSKVMDTGSELAEQFGSTSETLGAKVLDAKDKIIEKAKEATDKLEDKFNETLEKAEAFQKEQDAIPERQFAEKDLTTGDSLIKDTDDFFAKADKFADGDHGSFSEGKITIEEGVAAAPKAISKAAGFTDLDGDGNEMIDDAIIAEEE